jgi:hypothetical protein
MQQVIVYRNPAEAAFWNMLSDGSMFPIICGIAIFFIVFLAINRIAMMKWTSWSMPKWVINTNLAVSFVAFVFTVWYMN